MGEGLRQIVKPCPWCYRLLGLPVVALPTWPTALPKLGGKLLHDSFANGRLTRKPTSVPVALSLSNNIEINDKKTTRGKASAYGNRFHLVLFAQTRQALDFA